MKQIIILKLCIPAILALAAAILVAYSQHSTPPKNARQAAALSSIHTMRVDPLTDIK